ncbi:TonB-linked outer membrane protein, SusC/RagA family [Pedobacter africanus]|uniref:TonB-linked outer membrane protein, SusC/RagA family n=2 Tax=Pedobacter africanus TaxID=151894 RepID=A0A1W2CK73_9SPHI|nr:TonB-linked outer membrane protein, SusC/RagA family [Pedobacter africanus]
MKIYLSGLYRSLCMNKKILLAMKLTIILLISALLQVSAASIAQRKITLNVSNMPLNNVLKAIHKQSGYNIIILSTDMDKIKPLTLSLKAVTLEDALEKVLAKGPLTFTLMGKSIVVKEKPAEPIYRLKTNAKPLKISGTVKDELANPIPGVSVKVKGEQNGTVTNNAGKYTIEVEPTDTLEFSFIGYKKQTVPVRNRVDLNITLEPEEGSLAEVAVVGFGRQKKASLVGAQVTLKPEELKLPVRDLTSAIAGRLAGVVAYQRGGAPGADGADIFIRGIATFASSPQTPLLVVDGVPDRSINNIDPEDVESFTVLKDASATAVYGTRGANGVIIIITKKGKAGKPTINAEANQGASKFTELPKFLDAPSFMNLYNEGLTMRGRTPLYTEERIAKHTSGEDPDLYPNVNWYNTLFNKYGRNNRFSLNVRGGSETSNYYISAGYYGEVGMFKRDEVQSYNSTLKLDRFNFTSNVGVNITGTTKLDFGINGYITNVNQPGYGVNELFALATSSAPHIIPAKYSNGLWPQLPGTLPSPFMALTQSGVTNTYNNAVRSNLKVVQDMNFITQGLNLSALFAFDVNVTNNLDRIRTLQTYFASGRDADGNLITAISTPGTANLGFAYSRYGDRRFYNEFSLNYSRKFGDHDVSGLALFNQSDYSDARANVTDYKGAIPYRQRNLVGRGTYGYKDRYFVEANFSYSGSDNFIPSKRYGFFPSIGAGWIVSNEEFFESLKGIFSHFKLRYTYGKSGNAAVTSSALRFLYLTTIGNSGYDYTFGEPGATRNYAGFGESRIGGDVKWESSYRQNLGIEMNFLKDDLQLIVELFNEKRRGILLPNYVIPYNSGFTIGNIPYNNIGATGNKGIDATLNYTRNFSKDNFFSFRGTFNYNKNLAEFDGLPPWRYDYLNRIGQPISQRFGYIATGLFKDQDEIDNAAVQTGDVRPGDIRYKDLNGDGIINSNDQTAIGYGAVPRIVYGLNLGGGFKKFDISLFFQGAALVDFSYASGFGTTPFSQGPSYGNVYTTINDRWTPENPNPNAFYPRLSTNQDITTNYNTSTWWIKRADYIRLKSAEIGYTFDNKLLQKAAIKRLRIFANGTNLLTFSKWKFWDPELGDGRGATYPNITTYNIGLRANFQ